MSPPKFQRSFMLAPSVSTVCEFLPSIEIWYGSKPSTRSFVPGLMMLARNSRAVPSSARVCTLNSALNVPEGLYSSCRRPASSS